MEDTLSILEAAIERLSPDPEHVNDWLRELGVENPDEFIDAVVKAVLPEAITLMQTRSRDQRTAELALLTNIMAAMEIGYRIGQIATEEAQEGFEQTLREIEALETQDL